jgi:hypothetical protein
VDSFLALVSKLHSVGARYVVIGVAGANYYSLTGSTLFSTLDRDLFLPLDPDNLLAIWCACRQSQLELRAGNEPLGEPLDGLLAQRVVERKALTRATDDLGLEVDLSLVMSGFGFEEVWRARRLFRVEGVEVPVARLAHIVSSKARANRPKDRLFLETHAEALKELMGEEDD